MIDDERVEERLRAYRPATPSPELRERAVDRDVRRVRLQPDRHPRSAWVQLVAAAVLLVAALLLHSATERIDQRIAGAPAVMRDADQQALDDLAYQLGDDANARLMARVILLRDRQEARVPPAPEVPQ